MNQDSDSNNAPTSSNAATPTDVAILIVTYNSEEEIEECLTSVFEQRDKITQEVIVLDNLSQDNTVTLIKAKFPQVKLIQPGENLGFAKGVNEAARHANSKYILLLNPDTQIVKNAIDRIFNFAESKKGHGLYGGRTIQPDGSLEASSCWGLPTLWSHAMFAFGLSTIFKKNPVFDPESLGNWKRDTVKEVGVITGCFLLCLKSFWDDTLQGFDERYFMYGEDVDLAMRTHANGCTPIICPEAELIHEVGKSSKTPTHKMILLFKGKACLAITHWRGAKKSLALLFLKFGVLLRSLPSIIKGNKTPERWHYLWTQRREWIKGYPTSSEN
ncbi:glycosyltransferase family 2 protein [Puniceicoccaceae bacterium K14]|nr:glycosyltransferase family 2 protein [Puniceicoccaceae bacterium K14]